MQWRLDFSTVLEGLYSSYIAEEGLMPGEAFARLVNESQRRNIKVRDVAVELLDRMKASQGTL